MADNNDTDGIKEVLIPVNIALLRRSARTIDDAVVGADGSIAAIQAELKDKDSYEFSTVRQLLTGASRLLALAQDEIDCIEAELDRHG